MEPCLIDTKRTFGVELEGMIEGTDSSYDETPDTRSELNCECDCDYGGCNGECRCEELCDCEDVRAEHLLECPDCEELEQVKCHFCLSDYECSYCEGECTCDYCEGDCDCEVCRGYCERCLDYWREENSGSGTRAELADYISRVAGVDCRAEGWNTTARSYWKIITDSSINCDSGEIDVEVITPSREENLLKGTEGMKALNRVMDAMSKYGVRVNSSVGMHVHWGILGRDLDGEEFECLEPHTFANLIKFYAFYEGIFDSMLPRSRRGRNPSYLASVKSHYNSSTARELCLKVDRIMEHSDGRQLESVIHDLQDLCCHDRYCKLNIQSYFKHGTVEFRHHSGTCDSKKALAWIELTQNILIYCSKTSTCISEDHVPSFTKLMILTDSRKELKEHYAGRREHFKEQYKSLTAYCTKYKEGYNE